MKITKVANEQMLDKVQLHIGSLRKQIDYLNQQIETVEKAYQQDDFQLLAQLGVITTNEIPRGLGPGIPEDRTFVDQDLKDSSSSKSIKQAQLSSEQLDVRNLTSEILRFNKEDIVVAIKRLGEENIAGFSNIGPADIESILPMLQPYELGEILNIVRQL